MWGVVIPVFAAAVAAVLLLAARRPSGFRIERSVRIKAPAERIFPLINSLQHFSEWSPFEDERVRRRFGGPPAGPGGIYDFEGPASVGTGRCAITGGSAPRRVTMKLDMKKPIEAHNDIEFRLEPDGEYTRVTWAMWGENGFVPKLLGLFLDLNGQCGRAFEQGLENLRTHVEQAARPVGTDAAGAGFSRDPTPAPSAERPSSL